MQLLTNTIETDMRLNFVMFLLSIQVRIIMHYIMYQ